MKQHLVSRVLLRRFANYNNCRVSVFDLRLQEEATYGVKHLAQKPDFILAGVEKTERTWQRVEKQLPHAFELLNKGQILKKEAALNVIKDCIALHWARSFAVEELFKKDQAYYADQVAKNVLQKAAPDKVLKAITGLSVTGHEATSLAHMRLRNLFNEDIATSEYKAKLFTDLFRKGRGYISPYGLEFGLVAEDELLLADTPVVAWEQSSMNVGVLQGVRWEQADAIFMVLGPKHVVALSQENAYIEIGREVVDMLNALQVQGALESVYYRPGSGLGSKVKSILRLDE